MPMGFRGRGSHESIKQTLRDDSFERRSKRVKERERLCFPKVQPESSIAVNSANGQIGPGTSFGTALMTLASKPEVKRALEIGTWYGGGSTVHLAQGLRDSARVTLAHALRRTAHEDNCIDEGEQRCCHSLVVTLELFKPAWTHARQLLRELPVWCVLGSAVPASEMLKREEVPVNERTEHFKLYYERDLRLMQQATPMLSALCANYTFDLVLIDGNEYTGWAEFNHVRQECKPKYLALHDTQTLKTSKIEAYLASNKDEYVLLANKGMSPAEKPQCEVIGCRPERSFRPNSAGWSIYQRVATAPAP